MINDHVSVSPELVKEQQRFINSMSVNEQDLVPNPVSDPNLINEDELVSNTESINNQDTIDNPVDNLVDNPIDNPVLDLSEEREIKIRTPVPDNEKIKKELIQQYFNNSKRGVFIRKVKKKKNKKVKKQMAFFE